MANNVVNAEEKATIEKSIGLKMVPKKSYIRKGTSDTFWNLVRVSNGLTLKDLSELTNLRVSLISAYLTGVLIPTETTAIMFCDLFGIDHEKGIQEFKNGHEIWENTHGKSVKVPPKKAGKILRENVDSCITPRGEPIMEIVEEPKPEIDKTVLVELLDHIYGMEAREIYDEIRDQIIAGNIDWFRLLEITRDIVDWNTYKKLLKLYKES